MDQILYKKALDFATFAHTGQRRLSGELYITHPMIVANTLKEWHLDDITVAAGLLHDSIEEGGAKREDIVKEFGEDVAKLVDGVTVVSHIHLTGSKSEEFVENSRKMFLVMARDLRVVLIKLADRLHNMQTLKYLTRQRQLRNAQETLEIHAPLAERLGMGEIKGQLEDLAFPYLYPEEFTKLKKDSQNLYKSAEKYIQDFKSKLLQLLLSKHVAAQIDVRRKHLYSLWRKLQRPEIDGDVHKIYDLFAARVLVSTVEDCYLALGAIHGAWHPVPYLGVSDFIANPKPNGYRSIHTKIFGSEGKIVEIQIRTHLMHEQAEMGLAAHWQYSEIKSKGKSPFASENKLPWVKQLVAWQKEMTSSQEYLDALKFDTLSHRNLVFSPVGDVYDLPHAATPIDYAYAVHTDLGNQAVGAKVNNKMVSLEHKLQNGDVVEIITDRKRTKPNLDWLKFVVTTVAKREIVKNSKS
ncbi:bifunctional (p)ppGpp synthetase/guanosine-3',5'-bis(diphosphate) 3'-pyrophosphohydrolase [Candidatus Amesbacteria bacterium]|nr:bifunctional (p)ppGpp synthetase/guanosine-3',5'-bis(diphosphate) 3'-pyrophosphohydrolase [Candidatus Amesbacteria bacterium]